MKTNKRQRTISRAISAALICCILCFQATAAPAASAGPDAISQEAAVPRSEAGRDISQLTLEAFPADLLEDIAASEQNTKTIEAIDAAGADDLNTITAKNTDGTYSMFTFPQPVKYLSEEDNQIKFIDNALIEPEASALTRLFSDVAYENKSNSVKVSLPKKLASGILVAEDGRELRMTPVTQGNPDAVQKEVSFLGSAQTMVEYSDAFGENIHLQYAPVNDGVKENILLEEYTGRNEFQFTIEAPGLAPDVTEGPVIQLLDEKTGEPVFLFKKAWAMDSYTGDGNGEESALSSAPADQASLPQSELTAQPAQSSAQDALEEDAQDATLESDVTSASDETSSDSSAAGETVAEPDNGNEDHFEDDIDYRIESQGNGRYLLTMTVNEDFLQDPDTIYPVLIDPYTASFTAGYKEGGMPYTTVFSGTSTTWPSSAYEYIQLGYRSGYGEGIGYIQFTSLDKYKFINPNLISRATINLNQTYGSSSTYTVAAYDSSTSVSTTSATYSVINSHIGNQQDITNCGSNGNYGWWITDIFKAWLGYELSGSGWNSYQFMLKATSTGKAYKQFYCSGNNLWFQVDYSEDTSVSSGTYFIRSQYQGKYLDHEMSENRTNAWDFGGSANQQWKITLNSDGTYSIRPMDNTNLAMEVYNGVDINEQPVTQYTYSNIINYKWRIIQNGDGTVRIMPAVSNSRALDVYGGTDTTKTFDGRAFPKRHGIDCQIYDYSGLANQKWILESVNYGCAWGHNAKYNKIPSASNCFGYALGLNIVPKLYMDYGESVASVALRVITYVRNDLGRSIRQIDGPTSPINSNEYRFCMRVGNRPEYTNIIGQNRDYHFWLQTNTGQWCDKPGTYKPNEARYVNPTTANWPYPTVDANYYNSPTIYFAATLN